MKILFQFQDIVSKLREFKSLCTAYKNLRTTKLKLGGCWVLDFQMWYWISMAGVYLCRFNEEKNYYKFNTEKGYYL